MNFSFEDLQKHLIVLKRDFACHYVRFHGQEPALFSRLEDLVHFSKKLGLKVGIKTNGWLITNTRLAKLLAYGLDQLYLSIDGPDATTHDSIRGVTGSFDQLCQLIASARRGKPDLDIYINSVVMNTNYHCLDQMVDLGAHLKVDRVSFVFINDKNTKDRESLALSKQDFFHFFRTQVRSIYEKSVKWDMAVDFSPFLASLTAQGSHDILHELTHNLDAYRHEIESFYMGQYGKYFYDRFGCFGPLDHASINYDGNMYGCCVVERAPSVAVGNILQTPLTQLWESPEYKKYRDQANESCGYAKKCASNFYTRKSLFESIYLDDALYPKNSPRNYYRYLKQLSYEPDHIREHMKVKKLRARLLDFYDGLKFYRELLIQAGISRSDIEQLGSSDILDRLPVIDKDILQANMDEIESRIAGDTSIIAGRTSGSSGTPFEFYYPLDFKRYIRQIAIFSCQSDFVYGDPYFSLTPRNCNQTILSGIDEPDYVKKIPIDIDDFSFSRESHDLVMQILTQNSQVHFLYGDSKYLLYIIELFAIFDSPLPKMKAIFLSYSYTNRALKNYIGEVFGAEVYETYGCSEVGPVAGNIGSDMHIFGDNILVSCKQDAFLFSDLDNSAFPFINYRNGDVGTYDQTNIRIDGRVPSRGWEINFRQIDQWLYERFPEIISYQFDVETFYYISPTHLEQTVLQASLLELTGDMFQVHHLQGGEFFQIGSCSKFKMIIQ